MRTLYVLFIALFITACSATGPKFKQVNIETNDKSILYIYRPDAFALKAVQSHFNLDGTKVIELKNNGYTYIQLEAGHYILNQRWDGWTATNRAVTNERRSLTLQLDKGKPTFVAIEPDFNYKGLGYELRWVLRVVPEKEALENISKTRFQENLF